MGLALLALLSNTSPMIDLKLQGRQSLPPLGSMTTSLREQLSHLDPAFTRCFQKTEWAVTHEARGIYMGLGWRLEGSENAVLSEADGLHIGRT